MKRKRKREGLTRSDGRDTQELFIEMLAVEAYKNTVKNKRKIVKYEDVGILFDFSPSLPLPLPSFVCP